MTDLDLLVIGAVVTFLAVAGAYIAIRHRANEEPVDSYAPEPMSPNGSQITDSVQRSPVTQPNVRGNHHAS